MLFRYMRARHRFKSNVEPPLPAHELAELIGGGKEEFDEVYIEPAASPPIVLFDGKADDVFEAIIKKKYRAIAFWEPQLWWPPGGITSSAMGPCRQDRSRGNRD